MKQFKSVVLLLLLVSVQIFATAKAPKNNPVFVLVHGAWHGGWCWSDVK